VKIRVLGAHNCESRNSRLMTLLVDDVLALDAGGLTSSLSFEEQSRLQAVLVTHAHYDHLRDIPALAMNLFLRERQIDIWSHQAVFDTLTQHFLNGTVYPAFHQRPEGNPTLRFHLIEPSRETDVLGFRVKAVAVNHSLPALGYQVGSAQGRSLFYSGDTGVGLEQAWRQIDPTVLFIETTAPDRWENSMLDHKHMTPSLLKRELTVFKSLKGALPRIVIVHMNPDAESEIATQLRLVARDMNADISLASEGLELII
jgi:ribonuclease BN (tRNA processing enzyme)